MNKWDQRYAVEEFVLGTEPHDFVRRVRPYLPVADRMLDPATGEGHSDVFLAQCGLSTEGMDSSPAAVAKAEETAALEGVDFAAWVVDTTAMRMSPGHYAAISSVCCHFAEPIRSRPARGIVDVLVSDGLFIGVFYYPKQAALEREPKDWVVLADMVGLQTAFGGLKRLIAEHCRTGEGGEVRSTVCLSGRKMLSDGIQSCLWAASSPKVPSI